MIPGTITLLGSLFSPEAFCSGGDQSFRGKNGYTDYEDFGRLNVLDLQVQIRCLPKPVISMVAGYDVGGGHVLHMVCDMTIAADNAVFGQKGPKVGSFDAGYGAFVMDCLASSTMKEKWHRLLEKEPVGKKRNISHKENEETSVESADKLKKVEEEKKKMKEKGKEKQFDDKSKKVEAGKEMDEEI